MKEIAFWEMVQDKIDLLADEFHGSDDIQSIFLYVKEDIDQLVGIVSDEKGDVMDGPVKIPNRYIGGHKDAGVFASWENEVELQRYKDSDGLY